MSASANLVVLMGNLTRDPEERFTPGGKAVTTLPIAVNRYYTDKDTGKRVNAVDFIDVSVWGRMAENCVKYLSKGRPVYIEGRLSVRRWETPNGEARSKMEVVARNVQFLGGRGQDSSEDYGSAGSSEERSDEDMQEKSSNIDEEIPF